MDAQHVADAVGDLMGSMGFDGECGRKLPSELEALGLEDVQAEGRVRLIRGGTADTAFFTLSLESLREALVSSDRARDEEIRRVARELRGAGTYRPEPDPRRLSRPAGKLSAQ